MPVQHYAMKETYMYVHVCVIGFMFKVSISSWDYILRLYPEIILGNVEIAILYYFQYTHTHTDTLCNVALQLYLYPLCGSLFILDHSLWCRVVIMLCRYSQSIRVCVYIHILTSYLHDGLKISFVAPAVVPTVSCGWSCDILFKNYINWLPWNI